MRDTRFAIRDVRLERVTGIEPVSRPWQGRIIATIRYPQGNFRFAIADCRFVTIAILNKKVKNYQFLTTVIIKYLLVFGKFWQIFEFRLKLE
jgi:hypothetical protein